MLCSKDGQELVCSASLGGRVLDIAESNWLQKQGGRFCSMRHPGVAGMNNGKLGEGCGACLCRAWQVLVVSAKITRPADFASARAKDPDEPHA